MSGLRDQLEAIRAANGALTPQILLEEARPKSHPLHNRFEWDNRIAAEGYRLEQAHRLIQSVRVTFTTDRPKNTRYYGAIKGETLEHVYEPVDEIALDPFKRQILLQQAEREWKSMQARYGDLEEFVEMVRSSLEDVAA